LEEERSETTEEAEVQCDSEKTSLSSFQALTPYFEMHFVEFSLIAKEMKCQGFPAI